MGFLHSIIKKLEPEPNTINLSIQGKYGSLLRDYQWYKKYGSERPYPILVHTLYDVSLTLHFYFAQRSLGDLIEAALLNPPYFPYLGRSEDLVKIQEIKWVDQIIEYKEEGILKHNSYIPLEQARKIHLKGVLYRLPVHYRYIELAVKKNTRIIRDFDCLDLVYVEANAPFESEEPVPILSDGEDMIWWCTQSPIPEITQKV